MKVEVTLTDDRDRSEAEVLGDFLLEQPNLQPAEVSVDCEHAVYIEFGTSPAAHSSGGQKGGPKIKKPRSEVEQHIIDWYKFKHPDESPAQAERNGIHIYHFIMNNGLAPHPFFRPAIHEIFNGNLSDSPQPTDDAHWLEDGQSLGDIADEIAAKMAQIITEKDLIYKKDLISSIHVNKHVTDVQPTGQHDQQTVDGSAQSQASGISEDVWLSNDRHWRS
jgi:hypothetical protein